MKKIKMRVTAEMYIFMPVDESANVGIVRPTKEEVDETWELLRDAIDADGTLLRVKHGEAEIFTVTL